MKKGISENMYTYTVFSHTKRYIKINSLLDSSFDSIFTLETVIISALHLKRGFYGLFEKFHLQEKLNAGCGLVPKFFWVIHRHSKW